MTTLTATASVRKPRKRPYPPPEARYTLHVRPGQGESFGVLQIVQGKDDGHYYLWPLASDFGFCYQLDRIGGTEEQRYAVCLDAQDGRHTCECKGHLRWGTACKHIKALVGCHAAGLLPS
jgi:hypothetical protein